MQKYDVIIVGGGQAGLSLGYFLKQTNLSFLILDKLSQVGEVWRNRYDSLTLFTPDFYNSLPGTCFARIQHSYPTKDEVADYFQSYAVRHEIPIQLNTEVGRIRRDSDGFLVDTNKGKFKAQKVVVATGPFQKPFVPVYSQSLSEDVLQLHSSEYKNPQQLNDGPVLVVGGGNSGAQIAVELSKGREVHLSVGHKMKFVPLNIGSKSIFWYIKKLGVYNSIKDSVVGRVLKKQIDPILGSDLKLLLEKGKINLESRTTSVHEDVFHFQDGKKLKVKNVIWSTGFRPDYSWINIPGMLDETAFPIHSRGVTPINGLYFIGLPWQHSRNSALLGGVGKDSKHLFACIMRDFSEGAENGLQGIDAGEMAVK